MNQRLDTMELQYQYDFVTIMLLPYIPIFPDFPSLFAVISRNT